LPLDRNSPDPQPLLPGRSNPAGKLLRSVRRRIDRARGLHLKERRFYYRILDFNSEPWRAVRQQAEPGRKLLEPLFDLEVLRKIVPPPDVPLLEKDIITDPEVVNPDPLKSSSGAKLLTGLMLWAQDNL
jgi:hypothetical protein